MRKILIAFGLLLSLTVGTARAQFCPGVAPWVFTDVPANDGFCGSITWMAQHGVTLGCQVIDANNRLYCPADNVRRDQLAAFMFRLSDALFPATCAAGQVMKWNGLAWACANDNIGGGGTVTSLTASTGIVLAPNPITASGTIAVNTATIQSRVTGTCAVGSYVVAIASNGTVTCASQLATALECVRTPEVSETHANGATFNFNAAACPAGYTRITSSCRSTTFFGPRWTGTGTNNLAAADCQGVNDTGASITIRAGNICCRVPGS